MTPKQRKPAGVIATSIAVILLLLLIVGSFAAMPLLALLVGMGFGYILELFTGDYVIQAFNALGLQGVADGDLPKVFGLLALIAVLFKGRVPTQTKRKGDD